VLIIYKYGPPDLAEFVFGPRLGKAWSACVDCTNLVF